MKRYGKSHYIIVHYLHYLHYAEENPGHNARIFFTIKKTVMKPKEWI